MICNGRGERFVEDLNVAEWLREKTENRSVLDILFFSEVTDHLERVPTMDEFNATKCVYHPEEGDMMRYLLGERMGCPSQHLDTIVSLIDPQRLYDAAEARMGIKVLESRVAINFM